MYYWKEVAFIGLMFSFSDMKQCTIVLLVACVVLAYQLHIASAQFSFSLPGQWGGGKRSAQNMDKFFGNKCSGIDLDSLYNLYLIIQVCMINEQTLPS